MKKDILIYGAGKSGLAVEEFYKNKGISTVLYDDNKEITESESIDFKKIKMAVISPGISEFSLLHKKIVQWKIPILSEIELGYRNVKGRMIAITGTNGKTTTATLIAHIINLKNRNAFLAGNVGIPLLSLHQETDRESQLICEVSSFQLLQIVKFRPRIAVVLNLSPDHLIRHGTFKKYIEAKCNIFKNQKKRDFCVLNYDDQLTRNLNVKTLAKVVYFSKHNQFKNTGFCGVFCFDDRIFYKQNKETVFVMNISHKKLIGEKNIENILAAVTVALLCKIDLESIKFGVKTFSPLPNRLEVVKIVGRTKYVNDSKATNIDSTIAALNAFNEKIVLMLGGSDKGEDFLPLFAKIKENVHKIIIYGETKEHICICADIANYKNYTVSQSFQEAFEVANRECQMLSELEVENVLLLSPGCASFDEFQDYEQRGRAFRELVNKL